MKKEKIIVTSGDFDPITLRELNFLQKCKSKGDWLAVGLHSDMLLSLKNGFVDETLYNRMELISNLKCVDEVFQFNDGDGTVCNLLKLVKYCYPLADITYISEYDMHNTPETKIRGINFEVIK